MIEAKILLVSAGCSMMLTVSSLKLSTRVEGWMEMNWKVSGATRGPSWGIGLDRAQTQGARLGAWPLN